MNLTKGKVFSVYGNNCSVRLNNGTFRDCFIRGNFKIKQEKVSSPVVAGDEVWIDNSEKKGVIQEIEKRKNYIIRKAINLTKDQQIICSNVDKALIMITISEPRFVSGFLDRLLLNCEAYDISPVIVINKTDLLTKKNHQQQLDEIMSEYQNIGYKVVPISADKNIGIEAVRAEIKSQQIVILGQSGVGKSSLVNALQNTYNVPVDSISGYNSKGKHTTTFSQLFPVDTDTFVIDTPGLKKFSLVNIEKSELKLYFREIFERGKGCKFHGCNHINEPDCQVIKGVENGTVSQKRYKNYLNLYLSDEFEKKY